MSFLKVTIPGDFWDVQIYRGKLYLWTMDASVITLDWSHLVDQIAQRAISPLATRFGLGRGEILYGKQMNPLLIEPEFRNWLLSVFDSQSKQAIVVGRSLLRDVTIDEQSAPFGSLPVDTEIYRRKLYATTDKGIFKASIGTGTKHPISTRYKQLQDLPAVSLRAYGNQLALAACDEGLYRLGTEEGEEWTLGFDRMSPRHCDKADWVFQSIFAGSQLSGGYLAARYWGDDDEDEESDRALQPPVYVGTFDVEQIGGALDRSVVSWAYAEKIYTATENKISSSRYTQGEIVHGIDEATEGLGSIDLEHPQGQAITGSAGVFGTVIEYENGLQVVESDETQFAIEGPITRWRTYPRATNYENHLHVVRDDCVDVLAFYRDYLQNQEGKRFGVSYESIRRRRYGRFYGDRY